MLVLSRRPKETILFPGINTSVQVLAVKGLTVRLGIQAPPDVVVVRQEIADRSCRPARQEASGMAPLGSPEMRKLRHLVRNRLNAAGIGLAVLHEQLKAGKIHDLEATVVTIKQEFQTLRRQLESVSEQPKPEPTPRLVRKALLVEDDDNERELLAGLLRLAGLDVATAGDGSDALDYLRAQSRPDVLLLDMVLPRCDGPTMLREVRRDPALAGLKVFAVSGHAQHEFRFDADRPTVDRWFRKPIDPAVLLHDLKEELNEP
jgi:carbon storage regulator CsrA